MKNKILLSTLLLTLFGGLTISSVSCSKGNNDHPSSNENDKKVTMKLVVDTSSMKTNYFVGDKLNVTGLKVKLVTVTDGVEDEGILTSAYELSVKDKTVLTKDDTTITVTSNLENVAPASFTIKVLESNTYKYLEVASDSKMKTSYLEGEEFTSKDLKVKLFTETNGTKDSGVDYTNYSLSIEEGKKLTREDTELIIIANDDDISSTQVELTVKPPKSEKGLYEIVSDLVNKGNYTVEALGGQDNEITGKITKHGVVWEESQGIFFTDTGYGYGDYNGNTFRYKIVDGEITEQKFILDLGNKADDYGLFDPRTQDQFAENRISNYSINEITPEELAYVKTLTPTSDNANKYELTEPSLTKWLWSTIGHVQLLRDPVRFLKGAHVFIEIIGSDLKVTLNLPSYTVIDTYTATIKNIGTTVIPGLEEFLNDPNVQFPDSRLDMDLIALQKQFRKQNYTISNLEGTKVAYYNPDYAYGDCLVENNDSKKATSLSTIKTTEGAKIEIGGKLVELEPGYHIVNKTTSGFAIEQDEIGFIPTTYLENYDIWNYLNAFFQKKAENRYEFSASDGEEGGKNPRANAFVSNFLDFDMNVSNVTKVAMNLTKEQEAFTKVEAEIYTTNGLIGKIIIKNFGTTSYEPIESYIETLYSK